MFAYYILVLKNHARITNENDIPKYSYLHADSVANRQHQTISTFTAARSMTTEMGFSDYCLYSRRRLHTVIVLSIDRSSPRHPPHFIGQAACVNRCINRITSSSWARRTSYAKTEIDARVLLVGPHVYISPTKWFAMA